MRGCTIAEKNLKKIRQEQNIFYCKNMEKKTDSNFFILWPVYANTVTYIYILRVYTCAAKVMLAGYHDLD